MIGSLECLGIASSIYLRPSPVIGFLPGNYPLWSALFFGVGAVMLGGAGLTHASRRTGMFTFGIASTIHAVYGVGALGYSISEHMSWVLTTAMFTLAALYGLALVKIAGPKH